VYLSDIVLVVYWK